MGVTERISINHDICNGKPVVNGTRITVQTILEFLAAGETQDAIVSRYSQLTIADVQACVKFAH